MISENRKEYRIPLYIPYLTGNEKKYVNECLDSTWISSKGRFIEEFENKFCEYTGAKYATAVSNGTTALHLALETLGIGEGDEVIVPSFTYIASVSPVIYAGAIPVFADSLASTWQVDPDDVKSKITQKTKAIIVVHLYGHPCEMKELVKIAEDNNLFLVEDCAESFGALYEGVHTGKFGDISTFSFYGNKTISTGEGGMLITDDYYMHEKAYHLKMHGVSPVKKYWHDVIGFNYRMTNICAAIGLAQLEKADEILARKRAVRELYNKHLKGLPIEPHGEAPNVRHSFWMYSILTESVGIRDSLREHLDSNGIETRPTFFPVHTMPMFTQSYHKIKTAEDIAIRGINLPCFPSLKDVQIEEICTCIRSFF